jgi:hypothetical protein
VSAVDNRSRRCLRRGRLLAVICARLVDGAVRWLYSICGALVVPLSFADVLCMFAPAVLMVY